MKFHLHFLLFFIFLPYKSFENHVIANRFAQQTDYCIIFMGFMFNSEKISLLEQFPPT